MPIESPGVFHVEIKSVTFVLQGIQKRNPKDHGKETNESVAVRKTWECCRQKKSIGSLRVQMQSNASPSQIAKGTCSQGNDASLDSARSE
jgi:hypothetical protein